MSFLKRLSGPSLLIGGLAGFVIGAVAMGGFVNYLFSNAIYGAPGEQKFLQGAIEQVREGIEMVRGEQIASGVYGTVVSVGDGTLVLRVWRSSGEENITFTYDNDTTFVYLANDTNSTELPLSSDELEPDASVTVTSDEPVTSGESHYAVKIVKI